jgi:hypothetical protein
VAVDVDNHVACGTVELNVDSQGRWSVMTGPAPGQGTEWVTIAKGELPLAEEN